MEIDAWDVRIGDVTDFGKVTDRRTQGSLVHTPEGRYECVSLETDAGNTLVLKHSHSVVVHKRNRVTLATATNDHLTAYVCSEADETYSIYVEQADGAPDDRFHDNGRAKLRVVVQGETVYDATADQLHDMPEREAEPEPEKIVAYAAGDYNGDENSVMDITTPTPLADSWYYEIGGRWVAVLSTDHSEADWFADAENDGVPLPNPRTLPINLRPSYGNLLVYRDEQGELHEDSIE